MNHCRHDNHAAMSFKAVQKAIEDNIEEGRDNFKIYTIGDDWFKVSVIKNKGSYTTYIQEENQKH